MKSFHLKIFSGILFLLFASSLCFGAVLEFSADMTATEGGKLVSQGRIAVKPGKMRMETNSDNETQILIYRQDKNVVWIVQPSEKSFLEMPLGTMEAENIPVWDKEIESKSRKVGTETLRGIPCTKFEYSDENGKAFWWVSDKYPIPIRVAQENSVVDYKNIKVGGLAASLFEIPAGYSKSSMPGMPEGFQMPGSEEEKVPGSRNIAQ